MSPPAVRHVPVLLKPPSAQEQLLTGCSRIFWQRPPAAARKTSRSCSFLLLSVTQPLLWVAQGCMLFMVLLQVSLLCHAQNNPRKSVGKELFSPFKNRKEAGTWRQSKYIRKCTKQLLHVDITLCDHEHSTILEKQPPLRACKARISFILILQMRKWRHMQLGNLPEVTQVWVEN